MCLRVVAGAGHGHGVVGRPLGSAWPLLQPWPPWMWWVAWWDACGPKPACQLYLTTQHLPGMERTCTGPRDRLP